MYFLFINILIMQSLTKRIYAFSFSHFKDNKTSQEFSFHYLTVLVAKENCKIIGTSYKQKTFQ